MKKILLLAMLSSFLFGDIFNDLNEDKVVYFKYNESEYVIDETCDIIDIKKLITIQNDLIKDKKSKKFYLDLCQPFKAVYNLNKKVHNGHYNQKIIGKEYRNLMTYYKNSFYINFYSYLYFHRNRFPIDQNLKPFFLKKDVYSRYVNIYVQLKMITKHKKENYYKKILKDNMDLLASKEDIIYDNIAKDISYYKKIKKASDYEEFLLYRIKENDKRGISNRALYMVLANYNYKKIYMSETLETSLIKEYILKSYSYGSDISQTKLYMKLDVREHYLKLIESYPSYITSIAEFDLLTKEIENLKRYKKIIILNNYYLTSLKAFIYEKYLKLKYNENMYNELIQSYHFILQKEKNMNRKRRIQKKLDRIKGK